MTRPNAEHQMAALCALIDAAGESGQPDRLFQAADATFGAVIGHRLFTLMIFDDANYEVQRVYSSDPEHYPVGGRKHKGGTPWTEKVIDGRCAWIGFNAGDIRWAYPDHELLARLGLRSALNVPVLYDDRFLGTANALHTEENYYEPADAGRSKPFASVLAPAFLALSA